MLANFPKDRRRRLVGGVPLGLPTAIELRIQHVVAELGVAQPDQAIFVGVSEPRLVAVIFLGFDFPALCGNINVSGHSAAPGGQDSGTAFRIWQGGKRF